MNDICQIQIQIQNIPPCIWKYTHMCGFSHTCVVFTKHFDRSHVFGRNHTCVVFTTHMEVHVISSNSHTCIVFLKQLEWCLKTHGHIYFEHMEVLAPKHCPFTNFVFGTKHAVVLHSKTHQKILYSSPAQEWLFQ